MHLWRIIGAPFGALEYPHRFRQHVGVEKRTTRMITTHNDYSSASLPGIRVLSTIGGALSLYIYLLLAGRAGLCIGFSSLPFIEMGPLHMGSIGLSLRCGAAATLNRICMRDTYLTFFRQCTY